MNVVPDTVKKFVNYCVRPDNIQDMAYGSRFVEVDDGTFFICPSGFGKITEPKWHVHSNKSSAKKWRKCLLELGCIK